MEQVYTSCDCLVDRVLYSAQTAQNPKNASSPGSFVNQMHAPDDCIWQHDQTWDAYTVSSCIHDHACMDCGHPIPHKLVDNKLAISWHKTKYCLLDELSMLANGQHPHPHTIPYTTFAHLSSS
jgi:hypothetical protein